VAATVVVPMATIVFVLVGPLRAGWAARAGTAVALLGGSARNAGAATAAAAPGGWSGFTGRAVFTTSASSGQEVITVTARTAGGGARELTIVLRGKPDGTAIDMSAGSVRIIPAAGGPGWNGPVTSLSGTRLAASLRGAGGGSEQAQLTLVITGHLATGQVLVRPEVSQ
jgi:hypothetical protein